MTEKNITRIQPFWQMAIGVISALWKTGVEVPGQIVVAGGEPLLLYPELPIVKQEACQRGFILELISNGTLLIRYAKLWKENFVKIYISVNGQPAVYDQIRGAAVFAKVAEELASIRAGHGELILMSVLTDETLKYLEALTYGLPVDCCILYELIYLTDKECRQVAPEVANQWRGNFRLGYLKRLCAAVPALTRPQFPVPVEC